MRYLNGLKIEGEEFAAELQRGHCNILGVGIGPERHVDIERLRPVFHVQTPTCGSQSVSPCS